MVKYFSRNVLLLSATVLFTGSTSATKTVELSPNNTLNMAKTYTAHGSMDKKTALIIKYLMRNPHLQDRAYTGTHTARIGRHTSHLNVTYTIKGIRIKKPH